MRVRAALLVFAISEGQQIAMPERGAWLKAQSCALEDGAVKALRGALQKSRCLAALSHDDARQAISSHALRKCQDHLCLKLFRAHDVDDGCGFDLLHDGGLFGGRCDLRFENISCGHWFSFVLSESKDAGGGGLYEVPVQVRVFFLECSGCEAGAVLRLVGHGLLAANE